MAPSALRFDHVPGAPRGGAGECLGGRCEPWRAATGCAHPGLRAASCGRASSRMRCPCPLRTRWPLTWSASPRERLGADESTGGPVEPSGDHPGASKLAPVTRGLLEEFHHALAPRAFELLNRRPALRAGPSYWSISPIGRKQGNTPGGIPGGSMEDSAYFPCSPPAVVHAGVRRAGSRGPAARCQELPECDAVVPRGVRGPVAHQRVATELPHGPDGCAGGAWGAARGGPGARDAPSSGSRGGWKAEVLGRPRDGLRFRASAQRATVLRVEP